MSQYTIPTVVEKTARRRAGIRHLLAGCSPSGSSSSAPRSTTVWPTWSMAQLLHLESETRTGRSASTSTLLAARSRAMTAIYDTMQFVRAPVATICMGQACSAAAVLLAAGAPGRRASCRTRRCCCTSRRPEAQGASPT